MVEKAGRDEFRIRLPEPIKITEKPRVAWSEGGEAPPGVPSVLVGRVIWPRN